MLIAICSDIHDQLDQLTKALQEAKGCDVLICCGDLCSPFTATALAEGFNGPVYIVFGNNDADRWRISLTALKRTNLTILGEFGEIELDGKKFAIHHFDNVAKAIALSGAYEFVCCGHSHKTSLEKVGRSLLINPGEIYGRLTGRSTFAILDTSSSAAQIVELPRHS